MKERFAKHLASSGLFQPGSVVIVGYSGGADSTCLLTLLKEAGVDVIAAHLHHGMRPEADEEMQKCEDYCRRLDVEFLSGRADVPMMAREQKIGIEEAGRNARYAFFDQCLAATRADLIATAHTLDDNAETVLFNLIRGTGMAGLSGIPEQNENIVRPLLPFSRSETRAFCEQRELWFHDDPANVDLTMSRSRLRKSVFPHLKEINSAALENIAQCAKIIEGEDRFLNGMAAAALERSEVEAESPLAWLARDVEIIVDRVALTSLPSVLLARAVRLATGALGCALDYDQTEVFVRAMASNSLKGAVTSDRGTTIVEWDEQRVTVRSAVIEKMHRTAIECPGVTESVRFFWKLEAIRCDGSEFLRPPRSLDVVVSRAALKLPLTLRAIEPGDSFVPLGSRSGKRLLDLASGLGLSETAKSRLPVLCDLLGPVWVPGCAMADRVKVNDPSEACFRLNFEPFRA